MSLEGRAGALNDRIRERLMSVLGATNSQGSALNDLWFRYLRSLDYTGSLQDMKYDYLTDLVAIPRGAALNDKFFTYLREKGFTGALNDMLYQAWAEGVLAYVDAGFLLYINEDYMLDNADEDYIVHLTGTALPVIDLTTNRVLNLDMTTGNNYNLLSVTSTSAYSAGVGPMVITNTGVAGKPAGYPGGLIGARINGSAPAWDDGSGNALSGVTWRGPLPAATTKNTYSKPTPGTNGWSVAGATDDGDVPGPDGSATSARRITFTALSQACTRSTTGINATSGDRLVLIIKGTNGNKINLYHGSNPNTISRQFTLNGQWQYFDEIGNITGTPTNIFFSLNTISSVGTGGTNPTASQTVDIFMMQVSEGVRAFIQTAGANITRLAETVTFPYQITEAATALMEVDFSVGVPNGSERAFGTPAVVDSLLYFPGGGSGAIAAYIGTSLLPSPARTVTAALNTIKARVNNGVWTGAVNSTLTNNISFTPPTWPTSITIGSGWGTVLNADIKKVKIWNRALSDTDFANA